MTHSLRTRTDTVADLLKLQVEGDITEDKIAEVADSFENLGLTGEEAGQAMDIAALLIYASMPTDELRNVVYAAVKKVLTQREVSYG